VKTLDDALLQTVTQRLVAEFQPEQVWLNCSSKMFENLDDQSPGMG
jgi:hypothetical protein